jgi:UDP-GlcNAc:undecaprenyl-phosphate GlcNAc-1-phosphate transferase
MDGLAGGVAAIAAFFFLLTAVQYEQYFVSAMLAALTGAVIGFLLYNVHPASIFMGDAGSLFLGYALAVLTILGTYYRPESPTTFPIVVPLVVLAIPLYEMVTVTAIRMKKGLSPFRASKHHFSFRMRGLGLGVRGAVGFICLVTACTGVAALLLPQLDTAGALLDLLLVALMLTIVALLELWGGRRARREAPEPDED